MIIGDKSVGKTCLIQRYTKQKFSEDQLATIGLGMADKFYTPENSEQEYKMKIWDTAGQERFMNLTKSFYKTAHALIIAFDPTDRRTFGNV